MTQVLGTTVVASASPRFWLKLFVALTLFALVAMAAYATAKWIANRAKQARSQVAAQTGMGTAPSDVFEVEA